MRQYYFISGLPRSGSTLLSTILNQNPRFQASISGSLLSHIRSTIEVANAGNKSEFDNDKTKRILSATFDAYYADSDKDVIFDTNRLWTNLQPAVNNLFPYTKTICCVRDINWIMDSFEKMHQKNPFAISSVYPATVDLNVYTRADSLWSDTGIIKAPYDALKSALYGPFKNNIMLVEYELLCKNPEGIMKAIYNFIGQPYYQHDFNNVAASYDEYDKELNMEGLHTTRARVEWIEREPVLPPDLWEKYSNLEVWRSDRIWQKQ